MKKRLKKALTRGKSGEDFAQKNNVKPLKIQLKSINFASTGKFNNLVLKLNKIYFVVNCLAFILNQKCKIADNA